MTSETRAALELPDAPRIDGLVFRPFDMDRDLGALAELISESNLADQIDYVPTAESLGHELRHEADFDPSRDLLLGELDGGLVAATRISGRVRAGKVVHYTEGWVRPSQRRRGIGRALLHWAERRADEVRSTWPGDEPHVIGAWPDETQAGSIALFESEGYGIVRYGFMMVRSLADPIPEAPLPDSLEIRPVLRAHYRRIWEADVEAFMDHWERAERTEEDYARWFTDPTLDTSLWRVAWDGDEVAGSVFTGVWPEENARLGVKRGWLDHVSTRRPWRRRGVASALIADAMRGLESRGLTEAALGVDAENTSGALGVYEALGFRRHRTDVCYRKAL